MTPDPDVTEVHFDSTERAALGSAVSVLEVLYESQLLGMLMQDGSGVFMVLRPGHEAEIARHLRDAEWHNLFQRAIEYSE
jgi:hypothetical protein